MSRCPKCGIESRAPMTRCYAADCPAWEKVKPAVNFDGGYISHLEDPRFGMSSVHHVDPPESWWRRHCWTCLVVAACSFGGLYLLLKDWGP